MPGDERITHRRRRDRSDCTSNLRAPVYTRQALGRRPVADFPAKAPGDRTLAPAARRVSILQFAGACANSSGFCVQSTFRTRPSTIDQAIALAGWCKARITALHVHAPAYVPVPGLQAVERREADADLSRVWDLTTACFRAATDAGIGVDIMVDAGQPASRILDRAATLSADVIVMGTHGASGFQHLVLGSVTEKVLRKARCAVLTVPPRARATSRLPFTRLLCPVDFSDASLAALQLNGHSCTPHSGRPAASALLGERQSS